MSGDLRELTRSGRLANVLCRLAGAKFTGLVYVEHEDESLVISMRAGRAVFVEEMGEQTAIPDLLLEQGLVTKEQYADIATRVLDSLAENEDVAFCQIAIALGVLRQADVDAEIERRVRGRLIQAVAWEQCRIELDEDEDALTTSFEYPQQIGPIIYMGVRTFFDDERVRAVIGGDEHVYGRLLRRPDEIAHFFQLEPEEAALLANLPSDAPLARVIEERATDALEGWQLFCMLLLGDMIELSSGPFATRAERSGVRSTQSMQAMPAPRTPGSIARMPAVREEVLGGSSRAAPLRPGSMTRMPAVREESVYPSTRARAPIPREDAADGPAVREEYIGPARPRPSVREDLARSRAGEGLPPGVEQPLPPSSRQSAATHRAPSSPAYAAARGSAPANDGLARDDSQRGSRTGMTAAGEQAEPQSPMPRRRPVRKLSAALQRLDRELKQARPQPAPAAASDGQATPAGAAAAQYARAHVEQIVRMRQASLAQKTSGGKEGGSAPDALFRQAQEALRDQQFGRAYELMRKVCDADPNNEVYSMFCMWAAFRSNVLQGEGVNKLRLALRNKVSDDEHKAFAYYALGHISLFEKKDDAAEKFFRKALEFDKHNKDAERHIRIIELRRKTAATEKSANKIFGIEIGPKKS